MSRDKGKTNGGNGAVADAINKAMADAAQNTAAVVDTGGDVDLSALAGIGSTDEDTEGAGATTDDDDLDPNANVWDRLIQGWSFAPAAARPFDNEKKTQRTQKIADVTVLLRGGFGYVPGAVKLVQALVNGAPHGETMLDFNFFSSLTSTALRPITDRAKVDLVLMRQRIAADYLKWREANPQAAIATARAETRISAGGLTITMPEPAKPAATA
jgi:hypothetical protein